MSRRGARVPELVRGARDGDPRSVARLISLVEDHSPLLREAMTALAPYTGRAHVVGLTAAGLTVESLQLSGAIAHFSAVKP